MNANRQRWEYLIRWFGSQVDQHPIIDALGADGWELVSAIHIAQRDVTRLYFKRPIAQPGRLTTENDPCSTDADSSKPSG